MTSLTIEQYIQLKNQQEVMDKLIIDEEERKRLSGLNIERLESIVNETKTDIEYSMIRMNGTFEVILEIFKKQDEKIKALEDMVLSLQTHTKETPKKGPIKPDDCPTWKCSVCKRNNESKYGRCKVCSSERNYNTSKLLAIAKRRELTLIEAESDSEDEFKEMKQEEDEERGLTFASALTYGPSTCVTFMSRFFIIW